jgi:hypothetical protein
MLFSLLHKMSIGFSVVGVINGVVLQETFKVAATDDVIMVRQKKRLAEIGRSKMVTLFTALDSDGSGTLDLEEFKVIAVDPDVKMWLASQDIEVDDLDTLFRLTDEDGSGSVTVDEICKRIPRIKGAARSIDSLALRYKLNQVDRTLQIVMESITQVVRNEMQIAEKQAKRGKMFGRSKSEIGMIKDSLNVMDNLDRDIGKWKARYDQVALDHIRLSAVSNSPTNAGQEHPVETVEANGGDKSAEVRKRLGKIGRDSR